MNNWEIWQIKASNMSVSELHWATWDCIDAAAQWEKNGWCGGKYRDEASVYRRELSKR